MIAIDLGSNTLRCIEYCCETKEWGRDFERIVKTADLIHSTGRISEEAAERIVAAITAAKEVLDFSAGPVRAVTTAAMRMADNADETLKRIERECGIAFEIISDADEACYTMSAVRQRLDLLSIDAESFVLIDIGGGSTEVMFFNHGHFESRSFPVGIVTVAQQCGTPEQVRTMLKELLKPVAAYVQAYYAQWGKPHTFVATAGTPTTISAFLQGMTYETYDPHRINGKRLTLHECGVALQGLLEMDDAERAVYVGVGKETLIVAGVVIVEEFYRLLGYDEAIIVDDGLREGVAIAFCAATE